MFVSNPRNLFSYDIFVGNPDFHQDKEPKFQARIQTLTKNRITDVANSDLRKLINLQELRLADNNIIDLQKGAVRHLTGLQILDLSQNRIEVLQFGQFAGLTGLRIVNLAQNR